MVTCLKKCWKNEKEDFFVLSSVAEKLSRPDEALESMKQYIKDIKEPLSKDQRWTFYQQCKLCLSDRRNSYREALKMLAESRENFVERNSILKLKTSIEKEIRFISKEILSLIDICLSKLPQNGDSDDQVFYLKMKADHYKYLVEISNEHSEEFRVNANKANELYASAQSIADISLHPTSVTKIGLALNHSVFLHDVMGEQEAAVEMARETLNVVLVTCQREKMEDVDMVLQLLHIIRENLSIWSPHVELN